MRILFVCLGNICRSPAGENIMNALIERDNLTNLIECDSAGTSGYHIGSPPDPRMTAAAQKRGLPFEGEGRQFCRQDLENFDLILAMDKANYKDILRLDPRGEFGDKVKMICSYCRKHRDREVPDPYHGGEAGFEYVLDLLTDACEGLLQNLKKQI
jgi:protein-tyrosine phosphatase